MSYGGSLGKFAKKEGRQKDKYIEDRYWQAESDKDGMRYMEERIDTEGGATDNVPCCRKCRSERLTYIEQHDSCLMYQCSECGAIIDW